MIQIVHEHFTDFLKQENGADGRYANKTPETMGASKWEEFRSVLKTKKQVNFSEALIDVADGCLYFHSNFLPFRASKQEKVEKEFFDKNLFFKSEYRDFFDIFELLQKNISHKIIIAANAFVSKVLAKEYQNRLTLLGHKRIEIANSNGTKLTRPYSLYLLDKRIPLFLSKIFTDQRVMNVLERQQLREDAHKVLVHLEKQQGGLPNAEIIKEELSLETVENPVKSRPGSSGSSHTGGGISSPYTQEGNDMYEKIIAFFREAKYPVKLKKAFGKDYFGSEAKNNIYWNLTPKTRGYEFKWETQDPDTALIFDEKSSDIKDWCSRAKKGLKTKDGGNENQFRRFFIAVNQANPLEDTLYIVNETKMIIGWTG
jgi:hypothetical protein